MTLVVWTNLTGIAGRKADSQCPHVKSARSDLRGVTAAGLPNADQLAGWGWALLPGTDLIFKRQGEADHIRLTLTDS